MFIVCAVSKQKLPAASNAGGSDGINDAFIYLSDTGRQKVYR